MPPFSSALRAGGRRWGRCAKPDAGQSAARRLLPEGRRRTQPGPAPSLRRHSSEACPGATTCARLRLLCFAENGGVPALARRLRQRAPVPHRSFTVPLPLGREVSGRRPSGGGSAVLAAGRSFSSLCGSPLHPSPPWYGFSAPPLFCGVGSRNARLGPLCFTKNDGVTARFHHLRQRVSSLFRGAGDCGLSVGAAATRGNSLFKTSCLARPLSGTDLSRSFFLAGGGRRERALRALRFTAKSGVSACGRRPSEKPNCRCVLFFSFLGGVRRRSKVKLLCTARFHLLKPAQSM